MSEKLTPGPPTTTGTYFAVIKCYVSEDPQMCVLHYQAHKNIYRAVGHAFNIEVKAEDVVGYMGEQEQGTPIYGPNEYPDLSSATPEVKAETISGLIELAAKEVLKMFYAFGLKTHIECTVINEPTREEFDFVFRKKGTAAAGREEDAVEFAEWLNANYISIENKDGKPVYVEYGPHEYERKKQYTIDYLYTAFKQQKETP